MRAVDEVLEEIGAGGKPRLLVLNKADLLSEDERQEALMEHPDAVLVSALDGEGLDRLREAIEKAFEDTLAEVELLIPYEEGARLHELHEVAGDLERTERDDGVLVHAKVPVAELHRFDDLAVRRAKCLVLSPGSRGWTLPVKRLTTRRGCRTRAHDGDAGLDLCACEAAHLGPGERWSVGTGIAVEMPEGTPGWSCRGRGWPGSTGSRSSTAPA